MNFYLGVMCGGCAVASIYVLHLYRVKLQAQDIFSQLYQVLGFHDASVKVLDATIKAANGDFSEKDLLPYFGGDTND